MPNTGKNLESNWNLHMLLVGTLIAQTVLKVAKQFVVKSSITINMTSGLLS